MGFGIEVLPFKLARVSHKSQRIGELISKFEGQKLDPHYLAYFDCFNQQLFYEAHEVLEPLWLAERKEQNGLFYKALIQLAGAFVHLQKGRSEPATRLLQLAQRNLMAYPTEHHGLDVEAVRNVAREWIQGMEMKGFRRNSLDPDRFPRLRLTP